MTTKATTDEKVQRTARLKWLRISDLQINPLAQRELNQARVDRLAAEFSLEAMGTPKVSLRDGHAYVVDGQHRVEALRQLDFGDDMLQCETYEGLTEAEEADLFLLTNTALPVSSIAKYRTAITAGRSDECDVDRIVRAAGLVVTKEKLPGAIGAVGTLLRVYRTTDGKTLGRGLRIIRDAYGDSGFESNVIGGFGQLCARYNGALDDAEAIRKLSAAHGGVNGLTGRAEALHKATGNAKSLCVAAAAVDIINAGRGKKMLAPWWKA